jgi:hypothetical protein
MINFTKKWISLPAVYIIPSAEIRSSYVCLSTRSLTKLTAWLSGTPIRVCCRTVIHKLEYGIRFVKKTNPYFANISFQHIDKVC